MASAQQVTAPIRYGRLSTGKNRGNTYTMVFSRSAGTGQAVAIPCKQAVSTATDLITEAQALWKAEQPGAAAGRIADYWGCVAILCNPKRTIPEEILKAWASHAGQEKDYGKVTQTSAEGCLIDPRGLLLIEWPNLVKGGEAVALDLLLVTANDPEIGPDNPDYPDANSIATAWNTAGGWYAEYFWKNIDNGIRTFQDEEIRQRLHPRQSQG